jgi:hypothetical protein
MLFKEIIIVYFENNVKPLMQSMGGMQLLNVKEHHTYYYHSDLTV